MLPIKPISFAAVNGPTRVNQPMQTKELSQRQLDPVSFALNQVSFAGQTATPKFITPRFEPNKPTGQRLNYLA